MVNLKAGFLLAAVHFSTAFQYLEPRGVGALVARVPSDPTCLTTAWPPSELDTKLVPQAPSDELKMMVSEVDPKRIEAIIAKLVSFGTRHTLSSTTDPVRGIGAARDWIKSEFEKYAAVSEGRMSVEVLSYIQQPVSRIPVPTNISDVMATIKGSSDPDRVYVISGHYDSRVTDVLDYTSDAPGANDDASGVAVVMELARIMATHKPAATIIFTAVASEEQGLQGSAYLAQTLKNSSTRVEAMLNNDIIGSSTGEDDRKDPFTVRLFAQGPPLTESATVKSTRLTIGGENDSPARELARFVKEVGQNEVTGMKNVAIVYRLDRYGRGGDHSSFLQAGYAAVRFTEPNEIFPHQHENIRVVNGTQYGDLIEFVDMEYVARVGRTNLAALWSLANAPGIPQNVTVVTGTLDNDSALRWVDGSGDIAGYEVVWRATDVPQWTNAMSVGDVNAVTVPLSKDNVLLGVRAVGKNGLKSPAVLPFPA